jgi:hypothetical protein
MPMDFDDRHIGFRGPNETMLQQFSDVADIGAAFNQVAGENATQEVQRNRPADLCPYGSLSRYRTALPTLRIPKVNRHVGRVNIRWE